MPHTTVVRRLIPPLAGVLLLVAACGESSNVASESSPSINACPQRVEATFPADFPAYTGAILTGDVACAGFSNLVSGTVELIRHWSTSDSGQKVDDFYSSKLSQGRWTVTNTIPVQPDGSTEVDFGATNDMSLDGSVDYTAGSPADIAVSIFTQNAEIQTAASPSTSSNLPTSTACGDPHAHVYSPDRLQLLAPCVTLTGTVDIIRTESDGDLHVLLRLDPGQSKYINAKNISAENGDLVTEPVCVNAPTQADAIPACSGYHNPLPIPGVGSHVAATGAWVLDLDHGWMELHPVFAFGAAETAPSAEATPPAATSPNPTPVVVNLCGAPQNPWNYTFCGGTLISAPDPGFCSYFPCISSFWNGTGYVVQCVDGKFSKSGGHTGVCSQHGGFKRNLYAP